MVFYDIFIMGCCMTKSIDINITEEVEKYDIYRLLIESKKQGKKINTRHNSVFDTYC
jgi:hypothetical protein